MKTLEYPFTYEDKTFNSPHEMVEHFKVPYMQLMNRYLAGEPFETARKGGKTARDIEELKHPVFINGKEYNDLKVLEREYKLAYKITTPMRALNKEGKSIQEYLDSLTYIIDGVEYLASWQLEEIFGLTSKTIANVVGRVLKMEGISKEERGAYIKNKLSATAYTYSFLEWGGVKYQTPSSFSEAVGLEKSYNHIARLLEEALTKEEFLEKVERFVRKKKEKEQVDNS